MARGFVNGYAFDQTRQAFLATRLRYAHTHWTRLRGLMGISAAEFVFGDGLWIAPSHGVHTLGMRFPIDVIFLDERSIVVSIEENLRPWRVTPITLEAVSVLELPAHTVCNAGTQIGDVIEIAASHGEGAAA